MIENEKVPEGQERDVSSSPSGSVHLHHLRAIHYPEKGSGGEGPVVAGSGLGGTEILRAVDRMGLGAGLSGTRSLGPLLFHQLLLVALKPNLNHSLGPPQGSKHET